MSGSIGARVWHAVFINFPNQDCMRLPGTRYQEHGWEQVRKLLGLCSLQACRRIGMELVLDPAQHAALLDRYTGALAVALRALAQSPRGAAEGNSYGDSVAELALALSVELHAYPSYWDAFLATLVAEHGRSGAFWQDPAADAVLRKKINDMYAGLRDRVDADNYTAATGQDCSPNKIYTYRMLDTAYRDIARLFDDWSGHRAQVEAILGRTLDGMPVEARQLHTIGGCRAEWIIAWSGSLAAHTGAPGPLHTRSKRFASLKNNPARIAAMLAEIGDYEELSANLDSGDDWQGAAGTAGAWLEDYWRVMGESAQHEAQGAGFDADRIVPASADEFAPGPADDEQPQIGADDADGLDDLDDSAGLAPIDAAQRAAQLAMQLATEQHTAGTLSLPPRYMELARAAQASTSRTVMILRDESLPIRLAVYQKLLGAADDSYPDAWLDPATGALPTLPQLAALDGISMPTLRKRRNQAIDKLHAASAAAAP